MRHEIGAFEAKNKFGTLLEWVANGEEVLITRHGSPSRGWNPRRPHSIAPRRARRRAA